MNKKLLGLAAIIVIGIASLFIGKKPEAAVVKENAAATSTSLTPDWNTYSNEKHGFEFKYPADYVVYEGLRQGKPLPATPDSDIVFIVDAKNSKQFSFNLRIDAKEGTGKMLVATDGRHYQVSGYDAVEFINNDFSNGLAYRTIAVDNGGNGIVVEEFATSTLTDAILSTFKFTPVVNAELKN